MATYTIQAPDGNKYSVQGPDNASQEDVQAEVLRQHPDSGAAPQQQQAPAPTDPTEGMSTAEKVTAGVGKAFVDTWRGAKQLVGYDKAGTQADIDESRQTDKALMATNAGQAGEMLGHLAIMAAAPGGVMGAAAAGAAGGALTPTSGDESRTANVALGSALGAGGAAAGKLLGKVVGGVLQPFRNDASAAANAGAQVLTDAGVPLNAAQQGGGKAAQTLANIVGDNPFVGSSLVKEQKAAFTAATLRTLGVQSETADAATMNNIKVNVGKTFDAMAVKYPIPVDNPLMTKLATITAAADSELGADSMKIINKQVDNIMDKAAANKGTMTGEAFQNARSSLSRLSAQGDITGHWAGEIHDALTEALGRNASPEDMAAITHARTSWRILKQLETPNVIQPDDTISPANLYNALNRQKNVNQMMYGQGDQSLVKLASAGKNVLNQTANSGTAQRVAGMLALGSSLSAVDMLARGDPSEALKVGMLGIAGPNIAKIISENPASARLIGQWARSKAVAGFRQTIKTEGTRLAGLAGASAIPSMGGSGVTEDQQPPEDLAGTEQ